MGKASPNRPREPSPSVADPRRQLLLGAYSFVQAARACPNVRRISLLRFSSSNVVTRSKALLTTPIRGGG
jgi:hypothetical protein